MWNENLKRLRARTFPRAVFLSAVLLGGAALLQAPPICRMARERRRPRGVCGKCHSLDQAISLRQGQAGWKETISKMVNLGAEGSEAEFTAILNYLVKNFGSGNANPATAGAPGCGSTAHGRTGRRGSADGARPERNNAAAVHPRSAASRRQRVAHLRPRFRRPALLALDGADARKCRAAENCVDVSHAAGRLHRRRGRPPDDGRARARRRGRRRARDSGRRWTRGGARRTLRLRIPPQR